MSKFSNFSKFSKFIETYHNHMTIGSASVGGVTGFLYSMNNKDKVIHTRNVRQNDKFDIFENMVIFTTIGMCSGILIYPAWKAGIPIGTCIAYLYSKEIYRHKPEEG